MIVTTKESGITIKFYQAKVQGYAYPAESGRQDLAICKRGLISLIMNDDGVVE